jgi:carboxyl-terminal processing protease
LRTLVVSILLLYCPFVFGQKSNDCRHAIKLIHLLNENHIQPPDLGASFQRDLIVEFFEQIDPYHIFFSLEDANNLNTTNLSVRSTQIEFCNFAQTLANIVDGRLKQAEREIEAYLNTKLNYAEKDSFALLPQPSLNPTDSYQKRQLRRYLKYQVLEQMSILSDTTTKDDLLKRESEVRDKVKVRETKRVQKLIGSNNNLLDFTTGAMLKSIATLYDPHSSYFTNEEMIGFQNELSSSILSYGLDFWEDETGDLTVNSLVPGGAAWQSNEIHEGDVILSIKWENNEKISARDFSPAELRDKLELNKNRKAEITVRKKDGTTAIVKLEKSIVQSDNNHVDGYILTGKRKIGYIALPAFYSNWNGKDVNGCANDVAAELIKLKKENIQGLILDLRFNGGGSTKEAMELAGIFINVGPLMVLQTKKQPLYTLKDATPGAAYTGPLVILVNGLSASASEMIAASLQDHQRALIVGTPTFGKSNGQSVYPIVEKDTVAHVKVTNGRLYRITGKSYQRQGVQPDIGLPDVSQYLGYNEGKLPNALPNDSINKKTYYTPLQLPSIAELRKRSTQRISGSRFFQQFQKMEFQQQYIRLHMDEFIKHMREDIDEFDISVEEDTTAAPYVVTHNHFNRALLQIDQYRNEMSVEFIQELTQSPYLQEAYNILIDYLELENKK